MAAPTAGWHIEHIKAELRRLYGPLTKLALSWGLNSNAISNVLAQPGYSRPTERRIAKALRVTPHEIWPDRWHPDGAPISFRVDRTPSRSERVAQRKKERAA